MTPGDRSGLLQDWSANRGRPGIQLVLVLFRLAQGARGGGGRLRRLLAAPLMLFYRLVALRLFSIDLPVSTSVGRGLSEMFCARSASTCRSASTTMLRNFSIVKACPFTPTRSWR
jgi:hypothetical protein